MILGFDTSDEPAAAAALCLYVVYRSRDRARFKVTPDMWGQIERFTKMAAKRATSLPAFIEALKPRLACDTLRPAAMRVGLSGGEIPFEVHRDPENGAVRHLIARGPDPDAREFLTGLFERADARAALKRAYAETAWVVLLVRERLEREKPIEDAHGDLAPDLPPEAVLTLLKPLETA